MNQSIFQLSSARLHENNPEPLHRFQLYTPIYIVQHVFFCDVLCFFSNNNCKLRSNLTCLIAVGMTMSSFGPNHRGYGLKKEDRNRRQFSWQLRLRGCIICTYSNNFDSALKEPKPSSRKSLSCIVPFLEYISFNDANRILF